MAVTRRKQAKRPAHKTEEDTAVVLAAVAVGVFSFVTLMVAMVKFLQWAPGPIVMEAFVAALVFAVVVGRALVVRANSLRNINKTAPPVLQLRSGRRAR